MEWLVAEHIAGEFAAGEHRCALSRRPLSQLTVDFLCDLADAQAARPGPTRCSPTPRRRDAARANAIQLTTRLRTPATTDLRGASCAARTCPTGTSARST